MAIVYRHIRLDKNEAFYIGIGKTQKKIVCAYCKKEGGELAMKRYHLDNCKYKIQHNY